MVAALAVRACRAVVDRSATPPDADKSDSAGDVDVHGGVMDSLDGLIPLISPQFVDVAPRTHCGDHTLGHRSRPDLVDEHLVPGRFQLADGVLNRVAARRRRGRLLQDREQIRKLTPSRYSLEIR